MALSAPMSPSRTRSARWLLSMPDERARAVGAANTLWYDGDTLRSTNTDIEGFLNNLDACAPGWDGTEDALVLGAGGSSRAVIFGLIERGIARVHLANRTSGARARAGGPVRASSSGRMGRDRRRAAGRGTIGEHHVARHEGTAAGLQIELGKLPPHAVVADLVYVPLRTPLLAAARARAEDRRWPRHAAASGGRGLSCGSASAPR